jgi:hypothetical protein
MSEQSEAHCLWYCTECVYVHGQKAKTRRLFIKSTGPDRREMWMANQMTIPLFHGAWCSWHFPIDISCWMDSWKVFYRVRRVISRPLNICELEQDRRRPRKGGRTYGKLLLFTIILFSIYSLLKCSSKRVCPANCEYVNWIKFLWMTTWHPGFGYRHTYFLQHIFVHVSACIDGTYNMFYSYRFII